jgi:hypothetical protein
VVLFALCNLAENNYIIPYRVFEQVSNIVDECKFNPYME